MSERTESWAIPDPLRAKNRLFRVARSIQIETTRINSWVKRVESREKRIVVI